MIPSGLSPSVHELSAIRVRHDQAAFAALLKRWMPEIETIAGKFARNAFDRDDYVQVGSLTLYQVCTTGAVGSGETFVRYARRAVRLAMIDMARGESSKDRSLVTFVTSDELPDRETAGPGPEEILLQNEREAYIRRSLATVRARSRVLYDRMYIAGLSQAEVAAELKVTPTRVSQLHRMLLAEVRRGIAHLN